MMEEILCHSCTLCLPIQPDSSGTMVNMISAIYNIDGRMHLDTADLCPCKILFIVNMMDMIIFYQRKNTTQVSDYTRLTTIVNIAMSYNMMTYFIL